jgi:hypothetical protein
MLDDLDRKVQVVMPYEHALWYGAGNTQGSASIAIASGAWIPVMVVPADERWRLVTLFLERDSGDNLFSRVRVVHAAEYVTGGNSKLLSAPFTAAASVFIGQGSPLPLEPGASIEVLMGGVGIAASVVIGFANIEATKMIRQRGPS